MAMTYNFDKFKAEIREEDAALNKILNCDQFSRQDYLKATDGLAKAFGKHSNSGIHYGYNSYKQYVYAMNAMNAIVANDINSVEENMRLSGLTKDSKVSFTFQDEPRNPYSEMQHRNGNVSKSILQFAEGRERPEIVQLLNEKFSPTVSAPESNSNNQIRNVMRLG
ncbi:MAG: hypothetical protein U1E78_12415 [Gammaproteobacteria bacterium]